MTFEGTASSYQKIEKRLNMNDRNDNLLECEPRPGPFRRLPYVACFEIAPRISSCMELPRS